MDWFTNADIYNAAGGLVALILCVGIASGLVISRFVR